MKSLVFKEMLILSKIEKKARRIKLSPTCNLILGENDVGKSTFIKSLYYALGADTPKLENTKWKGAKAIYLLRFSIGENSYQILRDERYFGLFNDKGDLLGKYKGISSEGGVSEGINPLLNFNIELEAKDGVLRRLGPAYYFLPFYIDQDDGWNKAWASFKGLDSINSYRKEMLDYHLGIRPQKYYDLQKELFALNQERNLLENKKDSFIEVRDNFKNRKNSQHVDIDPIAFKADIEELVAEYNKMQEEQQAMLNSIKKSRNEKLSIENEIDILKRTANELDSDYKYCESSHTPDIIDCPTCGTEFTNSITERFGLLDDIDYCLSLVDQKQKDLINIQEELNDANDVYDKFIEEINSITTILQRKKSDVTFAEMVTAEGYKEVVHSLGEDITAIDTRQVIIDSTIIGIKKEIKSDPKTKQEVTNTYQEEMKNALHKLNVHVVSEDAYKTLGKVVINDTTGSDLPRALLAQHISLLNTMNKHNKFIQCPLIVDSPLQQEQDDTNSEAILNFIFDGRLEGQQLILGTVTIEGKMKADDLPADCNVISFDKKFSILLADEYSSVFNEISPFQDITLSTE